MSHEPIPQAILAEFAAAYASLMRCRRPGSGAAVLLRLSVDRAGLARLDPESIEGISFTSLVGRESGGGR